MNSTVKITREEKLLTAALCELGNFAHKTDVMQTAINTGLSLEHVRRHLRGIMWDLETGKKIYDDLRRLTLLRTHAVIDSLEKAA